MTMAYQSLKGLMEYPRPPEQGEYAKREEFYAALYAWIDDQVARASKFGWQGTARVADMGSATFPPTVTFDLTKDGQRRRFVAGGE